MTAHEISAYQRICSKQLQERVIRISAAAEVPMVAMS